MDERFIDLLVSNLPGLAMGILAGLIVLAVEHRTTWFTKLITGQTSKTYERLWQWQVTLPRRTGGALVGLVVYLVSLGVAWVVNRTIAEVILLPSALLLAFLLWVPAFLLGFSSTPDLQVLYWMMVVVLGSLPFITIGALLTSRDPEMRSLGFWLSICYALCSFALYWVLIFSSGGGLG
jgi:hypothetical protein